MDCSFGIDTITGSGSSVDDVVQNKLAVAYAESSQFHETNKELMAIREHAIMKNERISKFSTNFPWQVCVCVCVCVYVCVHARVCSCACMHAYNYYYVCVHVTHSMYGYIAMHTYVVIMYLLATYIYPWRDVASDIIL